MALVESGGRVNQAASASGRIVVAQRAPVSASPYTLNPRAYPCDREPSETDGVTIMTGGAAPSLPVRILVTDPFGRRAGANSAVGPDVNGIPRSTFLQGQYPGIVIEEAVPGRYTVDVLGMGRTPGSYRVTIGAATGFDTAVQEFSGQLAPGQRVRLGIDALTFRGVTNVFAVFGSRVEIGSGSKMFKVDGTFALCPGKAISPAAQRVMLQLGTGFSVVIPALSFRPVGNGANLVFEGIVNGIALRATVTPTGSRTYAFSVAGTGTPSLPIAKPDPSELLEVRLGIGNNGGEVSVDAQLDR